MMESGTSPLQAELLLADAYEEGRVTVSELETHVEAPVAQFVLGIGEYMFYVTVTPHVD